MPPASPSTPPARKPRQVVDLELDSVALTENPSNEAAEIFIVRNKGGRVPTESPEEVARAAEVVDLKRRMAELQAVNDRMVARQEEADCAEIVRSTAPSVAVEGVEMGSMLRRVRRAAAAIEDKQLETDFLKLLRASEATGKAAAVLTRTLGTSSGDNSPGLESVPAELHRYIQPHLKPGVTIQRAIVLAAADAGKSGDNAAYTALSSLKVS